MTDPEYALFYTKHGIFEVEGPIEFLGDVDRERWIRFNPKGAEERTITIRASEVVFYSVGPKIETTSPTVTIMSQPVTDDDFEWIQA